MAYVYAHFKESDRTVFYIGIGKDESGQNKRAYDSNKRSKYWKSIVQKHGFYTEIIADNITWECAIEKEIELIAKYGRSNNNTGILCNLTDGGEGCKGFVITPEYRAKLSKALKGVSRRFGKDNHFYGKKHTLEVRAKISKSLTGNPKITGENNPNFGKQLTKNHKEALRQFRTGKKHTEETKLKIQAWGKGKPKTAEWKAKVSGEKNGFYGKGHLRSGNNSPTAKECIFIETGEKYKCLTVACKEKGLSYHTQRAYLNPNHKRHINRKFNYL